MNIIGDVSKHHCIIVDDIIDSGGTICNAAQALIDVGAISVDAYVTHGVLSGSAVSNISNSPLSSKENWIYYLLQNQKEHHE